MGIIHLVGTMDNKIEKDWVKNFNRIIDIKEETGEIPTNDKWIKKQIIYYKNNKLSEDKIKLLEYLNIDWYEIKYYQSIIDKLNLFFEENGNLNIPEDNDLYYKYHKLRSNVINNKSEAYKLIIDQFNELEEKVNGRKETNIN